MRYLHMYVVGRSSERGTVSAAGTSICLNAILVNSRPKFIGIPLWRVQSLEFMQFFHHQSLSTEPQNKLRNMIFGMPLAC